jgi:hypothetical protein
VERVGDKIKRLSKNEMQIRATGLASQMIATCSKQAPAVLRLAARIAKASLEKAKVIS